MAGSSHPATTQTSRFPVRLTSPSMTATPEITSDGVIVGPPEPARKNAMDRFIDSIEWIAAFFVGIVALNTFVAVFMRKFFAVTIPDYYNFGQFLLGILIFWGIAATSYRGTHITVDLVWAKRTPKYQRWIDVFATLVLLFVVTVQTYTLFDKVATPAPIISSPWICRCRSGRSSRSRGSATSPRCC